MCGDRYQPVPCCPEIASHGSIVPVSSSPLHHVMIPPHAAPVSQASCYQHIYPRTCFHSSVHASFALTFFCSCPSRLFLHVHSSFRSPSYGLTSRRSHSVTAITTLHVTLNSIRYLRSARKLTATPPRLSDVSANLAVGQLLPIAPSLPSTKQCFKRPAFHPFLLQATDGTMMPLALCPRLVSQAPQHFRSSETRYNSCLLYTSDAADER